MGDGGNGYIKLHRKCFDCDLFKELPFDRWHAFEFLLLRARRFPSSVIIKGQQVKLDVGQLIYGERSLAECWGWSRDKVRRFLKLLENLEMITVENTPLGSIISITNYAKYQCFESDTANDTTNNTSKNVENYRYAEDGATTDRTTDKTTNKTNKKKDNNIYIKSVKEKPERKIIPPTLEMVSAYCESRNNNINPEYFCDYYESRDWFIGKNKMKDWQAAIRTWESRNKERNISQAVQPEVKKYDV